MALDELPGYFTDIPKFRIFSAFSIASENNISHVTVKKKLQDLTFKTDSGLIQLTKNKFIQFQDPNCSLINKIYEIMQTEDFKRDPYQLLYALTRLNSLFRSHNKPTKANLLLFLDIKAFNYLIKNKILVITHITESEPFYSCPYY